MPTQTRDGGGFGAGSGGVAVATAPRLHAICPC